MLFSAIYAGLQHPKVFGNVLAQSAAFAATLNRLGIPVSFTEIPGAGHEFVAWTKHLEEMMRTIQAKTDTQTTIATIAPNLTPPYRSHLDFQELSPPI